MISNQALLQSHKNTLLLLLQTLEKENQFSLPQVDEMITQEYLTQIEEIVRQQQREYQQQLEDQEKRLKEVRDERDELIKAAQAIEMESELTKRTIQFDINKLQHSIQEIEKRVNVGLTVIYNEIAM